MNSYELAIGVCLGLLGANGSVARCVSRRGGRLDARGKGKKALNGEL